MLDEICGFILWFEALMNRKVMLVADLEKTKFANVYILVIWMSILAKLIAVKNPFKSLYN